MPLGRATFSKSVVQARQLTQRGLSEMEHENWIEAERTLARAVRTCDSCPEARRYYARVLWKNGSRLEAMRQMREAMRLAPEDQGICREMAEFQLAEGNRTEARQLAETAIDLDPRTAANWISRAKIHQQTGELQQALADYQRALGLEPNHPEVLLEIAELYRQLNQPARALAALQTLQEQYAPDEEPAHIYYLMGLAAGALARHEDAIANFQLARQRGDQSADLLFRLAEAQLAAGDAHMAERTAGELLARWPQHPGGRELTDRIRTTQIAKNGPQLR